MCTNQKCVFADCNLCRCRDCYNFSALPEQATGECIYCENEEINPEDPTCEHFSCIDIPLVGTTEAAKILHWDRRKVATYHSRHLLPMPIASLASGPVWTRKQIEGYRDSKGTRAGT